MFDDYVQASTNCKLWFVIFLSLYNDTNFYDYIINTIFIYTYAENRYWYLYLQILLLQYLVLKVMVKIRISGALITLLEYPQNGTFIIAIGLPCIMDVWEGHMGPTANCWTIQGSLLYSSLYAWKTCVDIQELMCQETFLQPLVTWHGRDHGYNVKYCKETILSHDESCDLP